MAEIEKVLLSDVEVASRLGVSLATVRKWRAAKRGPEFIKLPSGSVRYRPRDVTAWVESGQRQAG